jgi:hypothetical protein
MKKAPWLVIAQFPLFAVLALALAVNWLQNLPDPINYAAAFGGLFIAILTALMGLDLVVRRWLS